MELFKRVGVVFIAGVICAGLLIPGILKSQGGRGQGLEMQEMDELDPMAPPMMGPGKRRPEKMREGGSRPPKMREQRGQRMLNRLKDEDPARYKRVVKIRELAQEYRNTDDEKHKKEIEEELKPLVDKELKQQQEDARKKVEEMEKKLNHMKEILERRDANWDDVVDHNMKKITGQTDYLEFPLMPRKR